MGFDKTLCIDNIYALAKEKNVKIGEIEDAAGVSKGYLSRLAKSEKPASPSIELLEAAASQLGVSLEYLIRYDKKTFTNNETFVFQFIEKLSKLSAAGQMEWSVESSMSLRGESDEDDFSVENPLLEINHNYSMEFEKIYYSLDYRSMFHGEGQTIVLGDAFHTALPGSDAVVYITSVRYFTIKDDNFRTEESEDGFEVCLYDQKTVSPICSTKYVRGEIKEAVEHLYKTIAGASSRIGLDKNAKKKMQDFLNMNF